MGLKTKATWLFGEGFFFQIFWLVGWMGLFFFFFVCVFCFCVLGGGGSGRCFFGGKKNENLIL